MGFEIRQARAQVPAQPLTSYTTVGKLIYFSQPQFPHLLKGMMEPTSLGGSEESVN